VGSGQLTSNEGDDGGNADELGGVVKQ